MSTSEPMINGVDGLCLYLGKLRMIQILGQPKIAGWLTVTRQLQCADVACLTFPPSSLIKQKARL